MQENLLHQIEANKAFMSAVESKIACYILKNPKEFLSLGLVQFSEEVGVSQGSIINFANKHAKGGFPELKLAVATCLASVVRKKEGQLNSLDRRIDCVNNALISTQSQNSQQTLKEVARLILSANKIEIYGVYRSAVVATDFYYHLLQLGLPANFVSDVLTCAVSASLLQKGSLVIAVSSSGRTKDIIDAVKLAKQNGVKTVCITANKNSPLAKLSDYVLNACSSGDNDFAQWEIRLSQLVITDAICEHVSDALRVAGKLKNETMNKILSLHNVND